MKTDFDLERLDRSGSTPEGSIKISGVESKIPFVRIDVYAKTFLMKDCDLEDFAVNLLKALRSKKLKS